MNSKFLSEYIKSIRSVGAVAPSSRFLARKMVESIDFKQAKVIIEYGPGTGVFTDELVKYMNPRAKLLIIETNDAFCKILMAKYKNAKNVEVINASAEHVDIFRRQRSLPNPDYIVSGLPFAALPKDVSEKILIATAKLLGKKGEFITFQYTMLKKSLFAHYFIDIHVSRELRNIPPAYVLRCRNSS